MITAADLLAAHDALENDHEAYWFNELITDDQGALIQPTDATYFLLRVTTDPATGDFDGEAYSRAVLTVQAWSTTRGGEWSVRDDANARLTALGWERLNTSQIPGDNTRFGITSDYIASF